MPTVNFQLANGSERLVDVPVGWSLMEGARRAGIEGIVAECGGGAICGTCHVHLDKNSFQKIDPPEATELALLEIVAEPSSTSRLSCQVIMSEDLDDMTVRVPAEQLIL